MPGKWPTDFRRYLDISLGSLSEVSYLLRFAWQRGLLEAESFRALDNLRDEAGKLTWHLYASLSPPKDP